MKKLLPFIGTHIAIPGSVVILLWASELGVSGANSLPAAGQPALQIPVTVKGLDLSRAPTTEELMAAGQLGGRLYPTHELKDKAKSDAANLAFGQAIDQWNQHNYTNGVAMFRKYVAEYPDSPWAAEAALHVGCDSTYNGRYTEAEAIFTQLIQDNQSKDYYGAKAMLDKARSRLALVKVEQNNLAEAGAHFSAIMRDSTDWRERTYASHWIQRLSRYAAAKQALLTCGAQALAYALEKEGQKAAAASVRTNIPATMKGHSLADLSRIAADHGFQIVALNVTLADLAQLPLPALLHVKARNAGDSGHYWVLDKVQGDQVELYDPQAQHRFHQTVTELSREWTGNVLVFSKAGVLPGRKLDWSEMEESSGGCCGAKRGEAPLGCGDESGCCGCGGAPMWRVNMVSMNVYVADMPLWYTPPIGPPVRIGLSYNSQSATAVNEPFGNKWQFSYGTYPVVDTAGTVTIFMPNGRRDIYTPDGAGGYIRPVGVHNTLAALGPNHFELRFPNDTVYVYSIPTNTASQQTFLTEIRDAHGQKLSLTYDSNVHLTAIKDAQGRVTSLAYNGDGLVASVTDPFGRTARFEYDSGNLTKITDMGGYWSALGYASKDSYISSITDARGTYQFYIEPADGINNGLNHYPPPGTTMYEDYRVTITDPLGHSTEFYYDGGQLYPTYWIVRPRDYVPYVSAYQNTFQSSPKTIFHAEMIGDGRREEISEIDSDWSHKGQNPWVSLPFSKGFGRSCGNEI